MKYKLILFDMDGTLLNGRTIFVLAEAKEFIKKLMRALKYDIPPYKKTLAIARFLRCITVEEFKDIFRTVSLNEHAAEVVKAAKDAGIKTAIVTDSYQIAALDIQKRLGIDYVFSNELMVKNHHLTGEVILHNKDLTKRHGSCQIHSICKKDVMFHLCEKLGIRCDEVIAVGDGTVDICMLREAGLGIAFNAPDVVRASADVCIDNLGEILKYVGDV
jgi:phosphoserine phosphatase